MACVAAAKSICVVYFSFGATGMRDVALVSLLHKIAFVAHDSLTMLQLRDRGFRSIPMSLMSSARNNLHCSPLSMCHAKCYLVLSSPSTPRRWLQFVSLWAALLMCKVAIGAESPPCNMWHLHHPRTVLSKAGVSDVVLSFDSADVVDGESGHHSHVRVPGVSDDAVTCIHGSGCVFRSNQRSQSWGNIFDCLYCRCLSWLILKLLNTMSNLGGVWPKWFLLTAVDALTWRDCRGLCGRW